MDVSIIIINYNTCQLSKAAIHSVIEKTKDCSYEIIVVDNHSTEDASSLKEKFPSIHYIQSDKNLGFAGGNNLGIQEANGEYILLLNSDTLLKNDAVSIVFNYLKARPNMAVASARLEYPNGRLQHADRCVFELCADGQPSRGARYGHLQITQQTLDV